MVELLILYSIVMKMGHFLMTILVKHWQHFDIHEHLI